MARNKLTETKVKALDKPGLYGDGDGLWLRVQKSGSKNWIFIFRRGDERNELGLGGYGNGTAPVSLALAREKADVIRQQLARGEDPNAARRATKPKSFKDCAEALIEAKRPEWTGQHTAGEWEFHLLTYAKHLHDMPVANIALGDIKECVSKLWTEKPETGRRLLGRIKSTFDYAIAHGWRTAGNPAVWSGLLDKVMARPAVPSANHAALPYAQAPTLMKALMKAPDASDRVVELIVLTACRSAEVREAVWTEFDLDAALWTIPAIRMKAARDHQVPLCDRAMVILRSQEAKATNDYVFPGKREGRPISESVTTKSLRASSPDQAATLHGMRSMFRDWCGDCTDYPREVAEAALAHAVGNAVEQAYRRSTALEKRRQLMNDWGRYCASP